jgi:cobalt-precorrin 5A hydrolase/precorrin-3B C17-methyltransferase
MKSPYPPAIMVLGETSMAIARQIQGAVPDAIIYGLRSRTQSADRNYDHFGATIAELFSQGHPIIGICATGILIRSLAPLLSDKRSEPPLLAIAEDGSAVVPLLGGLNGANTLARAIAAALQVQPAITTTGELRFQTSLLAPPDGYRLLNDDQQAKTFLADLLAGKEVQLIGDAPWLKESQIPFVEVAEHQIEIVAVSEEILQNLDFTAKLTAKHLIYTAPVNLPRKGELAIVGIGPGAAKWISPEVANILEKASDFVGYKTYLNLVKSFTQGKVIHASDNRVEIDRAHQAIALARSGKSVVVVSSGDAGIYGMAAAVYEALESDLDLAANINYTNDIEIRVAPGISAVQAAAAAIGAPIGHDFCTISLSDILKPWEIITQRLAAAAQADFVIAIYNPISTQRRWQLTAARDLLLQWRSPDTPVILGHRMGRKGENIKVIKLADLEPELADMQTVIIVGSSKTRIINSGDRQWVYTPRKY